MKHANIIILLIITTVCCGCGKKTSQSERIDTAYPDSIVSEREYDFDWHIQDIQDSLVEIMQAIRTDNKQLLAKHVAYPFELDYPLPPIMNANEFVYYYDCIITKEIKNSMKHATLHDWETVGWRGVMFDNGQVWLHDYLHITGVTYNLNGKMLNDWKRYCAKEQKLLNIPNCTTPAYCFSASDTSIIVYVYHNCDKENFAVGYDGLEETGYRICLLDKTGRKTFDEQVLLSVGGSAHNRYFMAQNDSITISLAVDPLDDYAVFQSHSTDRKYKTSDEYYSDHRLMDSLPNYKYYKLNYDYLWRLAEKW